MKLMLEVYLKDTLFINDELPTRMDKRFWPSNKDIQNHIALAIKKQRNSNMDQVCKCFFLIGRYNQLSPLWH